MPAFHAVRRILAAPLALTAASLCTPGLGVADPEIPGGQSACNDSGVEVGAFQATENIEGYHPVAGTVVLTAIYGGGDNGPKEADFRWTNMATGATGSAHGTGNGWAGATTTNVSTGAGPVEITGDYTGHYGPFFSLTRTGQCTGTVTVK